ncbi:MAG TPA: hypothetical protein VFR46_11235 [Actinomycetes bacterium]|nr:hypothetical protein [Actinomycetes bacterium]
MTQAAKRPSTTTRRASTGQPTLNGHGPRGDQDLAGVRDDGNKDDGNKYDGNKYDGNKFDGNKRDDRSERDERDSRDEQSEQRARREQDVRRDDRADDRDERNERVERASRDEQGTDSGEQDLRREQGRAADRDDRDPRDARGEQWHGERGELGDGREPRREPGGVQRTVEQVTDRARSATSNPGDAFAGTPDLSKVLAAWFDMAGDMMKLQQQFFNAVLGAGITNARTTTKD